MKTVLRHSWLSDPARQESVSEHTWMMSLLAIVLLPKMQIKLDMEKVLKMIAMHDLAEAITKDLPAWDSLANKTAKAESKRLAILQILNLLDEESRSDLM